MDSSQARDGSARQVVHSEQTLTAYHQGGTEAGAIDQPSPGLVSNLDSWTSNSPHLDSQSRSLRQASLALDTAYERITHLRNSINNLLNRMPPEITGTPASITPAAISPRRSLDRDWNSNLRPPHAALVLSDHQTAEDLNQRAARLRSLIPANARQRLEEFESTNRNGMRRELVWDRFSLASRTGPSRADARPPGPQPRTPPMPDIVVPRTRDQVDTRVSQRRDLQSINRDDSSTMIGRRVAARLSTNSGSPESHGSVSIRSSLSQDQWIRVSLVEQSLRAQATETAQELENMTDRLASQRIRRIVPSSVPRGDNTGGGASVSTSSGTWPPPTPVNAGGDTRPRPLPPTGGRPDNTTRLFSPQSISRISADGPSPFNEFVIPTARRSLSAAYREHIASMSQDSPRNLANTPEVRGTLVNLLARERDEQPPTARQVDPIRLDGLANQTENLPTRSDPSSRVAQTRPRRGWTRLNADGDEIDSDEDDSMSLPTRHLRMRLARSNLSTSPSTVLSNTITIEDILWRTSGSDSEPDALSPDATESCHYLFQRSFSPATVCYPNPLPTPVEEMLEHTTKIQEQPRTICVSEYANLAGR